eukprot:m.108841 g.108841  ORF g.108841 m.108841 type:complete len:1288 (+) comp15939_c0_seq1:259-4122(+)
MSVAVARALGVPQGPAVPAAAPNTAPPTAATSTSTSTATPAAGASASEGDGLMPLPPAELASPSLLAPPPPVFDLPAPMADVSAALPADIGSTDFPLLTPTVAVPLRVSEPEAAQDGDALPAEAAVAPLPEPVLDEHASPGDRGAGGDATAFSDEQPTADEEGLVAALEDPLPNTPAAPIAEPEAVAGGRASAAPTARGNARAPTPDGRQELEGVAAAPHSPSDHTPPADASRETQGAAPRNDSPPRRTRKRKSASPDPQETPQVEQDQEQHTGYVDPFMQRLHNNALFDAEDDSSDDDRGRDDRDEPTQDEVEAPAAKGKESTEGGDDNTTPQTTEPLATQRSNPKAKKPREHKPRKKSVKQQEREAIERRRKTAELVRTARNVEIEAHKPRRKSKDELKEIFAKPRRSSSQRSRAASLRNRLLLRLPENQRTVRPRISAPDASVMIQSGDGQSKVLKIEHNVVLDDVKQRSQAEQDDDLVGTAESTVASRRQWKKMIRQKIEADKSSQRQIRAEEHKMDEEDFEEALMHDDDVEEEAAAWMDQEEDEEEEEAEGEEGVGEDEGEAGGEGEEGQPRDGNATQDAASNGDNGDATAAVSEDKAETEGEHDGDQTGLERMESTATVDTAPASRQDSEVDPVKPTFAAGERVNANDFFHSSSITPSSQSQITSQTPQLFSDDSDKPSFKPFGHASVEVAKEVQEAAKKPRFTYSRKNTSSFASMRMPVEDSQELYSQFQSSPPSQHDSLAPDEESQFLDENGFIKQANSLRTKPPTPPSQGTPSDLLGLCSGQFPSSETGAGAGAAGGGGAGLGLDVDDDDDNDSLLGDAEALEATFAHELTAAALPEPSQSSMGDPSSGSKSELDHDQKQDSATAADDNEHDQDESDDDVNADMLLNSPQKSRSRNEFIDDMADVSGDEEEFLGVQFSSEGEEDEEEDEDDDDPAASGQLFSSLTVATSAVALHRRHQDEEDDAFLHRLQERFGSKRPANSDDSEEEEDNHAIDPEEEAAALERREREHRRARKRQRKERKRRRRQLKRQAEQLGDEQEEDFGLSNDYDPTKRRRSSTGEVEGEQEAQEAEGAADTEPPTSDEEDETERTLHQFRKQEWVREMRRQNSQTIDLTSFDESSLPFKPLLRTGRSLSGAPSLSRENSRSMRETSRSATLPVDSSPSKLFARSRRNQNSRNSFRSVSKATQRELSELTTTKVKAAQSSSFVFQVKKKDREDSQSGPATGAQRTAGTQRSAAAPTKPRPQATPGFARPGQSVFARQSRKLLSAINAKPKASKK